MPRAHRYFVPEQLWHITHRSDALRFEMLKREECWSESIAVGSEAFVEQVKNALGFRAKHRDVTGERETYILREPAAAYMIDFVPENDALRPNGRAPVRTTRVDALA